MWRQTLIANTFVRVGIGLVMEEERGRWYAHPFPLGLVILGPFGSCEEAQATAERFAALETGLPNHRAL